MRPSRMRERSNLAEADATLREIGGRVCILDDRNFPAPTLEKVIAEVEHLKARTGATRVFILVDYLQVWPITETAAKNIRSDLDADKWRIEQMKELRNANNSDPVVVISEARKPSDKDAAWGGGMADVMGLGAQHLHAGYGPASASLVERRTRGIRSFSQT